MRKHMIWVVALALAVAVSAVSGAATTQQLDVSVKPSKAPKDKYVAGKLHVTTLAGTDSTGPLAVKPATTVQIWFDDDIRFDPTGVPPCPASKVSSLDTAGAIAACPKSIVGTGKATAYVAGNPAVVLPGVITAFSGPKKNGKATIVLQTRVDASGTTTAITGILNPTKGDLGNRLDVTIPPVPGSSAVGLFDVTIGKKTGKNQYISVRCGDKNRTLNYKGHFNYAGGEPSKTLTTSQKCTVRK